MTAERYTGKLQAAAGETGRWRAMLPPRIARRRMRPEPYPAALDLPIRLPYGQPLSRRQMAAKRALDLAIAGLLMLLLSPLMLGLAVLLALRPAGQVLVRQDYLGFERRKITLRRFYSPRADARPTRLGHFLWRSGLDELPLLLDVLAGTLSLVGPRAHLPGNDEQCRALIDRHLTRRRARPGITGWAQINGCEDTPATLERAVRRLEHDLYYLDRWSLLFDLRILARALVGAGGGRHAR